MTRPDLVSIVCCAVVGVYVGAMATEGGVLVPYWQSMPPADFLAWYAGNTQRLNDFFGVVTIAAIVVSLVGAVAAIWRRHPGRPYAIATAALLCGLLGLYFVYFEPANTSFATATITLEAVPIELERWAWWHKIRTVVSAVALVTAGMAARRAGQ